MMKRTLAVLAATVLVVPFAQAVDAHHKSEASAAQGASQSGAISEGEVRRVDKDAKKITLRHGPLANLDMPPMTMVFQVKNPAMVEQVKVGDKVKFRAEKEGGAFTITELQPAN